MGTGGVFLRKLRAKVSDQPTGFVWIEKGKLAGSGFPASKNQVEWIVSQGIDVVLTLTEKALPAAWVEGIPVNVKHIPMKDHAAPEVTALETAASYVHGQLNEGHTLLVHCLAGEGRTGCVLAAYLIKERQVSAEEAMSTLRTLKPSFVEAAQERSVYEYAKGTGS